MYLGRQSALVAHNKSTIETMASHVVKVTMIKVPLEDMDAAIEKCQNFIKNHQKVGQQNRLCCLSLHAS